jgi:hypothetical protein
MAWNQDGRTGDKRTQAAQMAKDDMEKGGGAAYIRVTDSPSYDLNVQVARVQWRTYGWTVTTYDAWVTDDGELEGNKSGSGVGTSFATEADAVAVAQALVKADWS